MTNRGELYDKLCQLLTAFEHPDEDPWNRSEDEFLDDFYGMLCEIANNWNNI